MIKNIWNTRSIVRCLLCRRFNDESPINDCNLNISATISSNATSECWYTSAPSLRLSLNIAIVEGSITAALASNWLPNIAIFPVTAAVGGQNLWKIYPLVRLGTPT